MLSFHSAVVVVWILLLLAFLSHLCLLYMDFALAGYVVSVVLLYGLCCGWLCCLCCGGFVDSNGLVMLYWLCGL